MDNGLTNEHKRANEYERSECNCIEDSLTIISKHIHDLNKQLLRFISAIVKK